MHGGNSMPTPTQARVKLIKEPEAMEVDNTLYTTSGKSYVFNS